MVATWSLSSPYRTVTAVFRFIFAQDQSFSGSWNTESVQSGGMDGGNAINLENVGNTISLTLPDGIPGNNQLVPDYQSQLTYNSNRQTFNGCLNISGSAMVAHDCGTNSGICGSGQEIVANPTPADCGPDGGPGISYINSQGQTEYAPDSDGGSTGGPITFSNGTFQGQPIQVKWLSSNGQPEQETFTPSGKCITESVNGANTGSFCP